MIAVGVHDPLEFRLDERVARRILAGVTLATGPSAWTMIPSMSAAANAASGGHHE